MGCNLVKGLWCGATAHVCAFITSVTIIYIVVCQIGSVVYAVSQAQRLTVCMIAVQDNVQCGGKVGICDLVFITQSIHILSASVFLFQRLTILSVSLSHTNTHSVTVRAFSWTASFLLFLCVIFCLSFLFFMEIYQHYLVFLLNAGLSFHSLGLMISKTDINTPWLIDTYSTQGLKCTQ